MPRRKLQQRQRREHDHEARHGDQDDIDHDPGEQQPAEPPAGPALVTDAA
jgi:hypothetical protein